MSSSSGKSSAAILTAVGLGVVCSAAGAVYYFWRKRKQEQQLEKSVDSQEQQQQQSTTDSVQSSHESNENESNKENTPTSDMYSELKNEGNVLFKNEKYEEAIQKYFCCLKFCEDEDQSKLRAIAYQNISAAYERLEQNENALKYCELAIENNPNYTRALVRLGCLQSKLGKNKEAVECFWKVLQENKHSPVNDVFEDSIKKLADIQVENCLKEYTTKKISNFVVERYFIGIIGDPVIFAAKSVPDTAASESGIGLEDDSISGSDGSVDSEKRRSFSDFLRLIKRSKFDEAYSSATKMVEEGKEGFSAEKLAMLLNFCGSVEAAMHFVDEAQSHLQQAFDLNCEESPLPQSILVNTQMKLASLKYSKSPSSIPSTIEEFERLVEKYPDCADLHLILFQMSMVSEGPVNSEYIDKALKLSKMNPYCVLQKISFEMRQAYDPVKLNVIFENLRMMAQSEIGNVSLLARELYLEFLVGTGQLDEAKAFAGDVIESAVFKNHPDPYFYCLAADFDFADNNLDSGYSKVLLALKTDPYLDKAHMLNISALSLFKNTTHEVFKSAVEKFAEACPVSPSLVDAYRMLELNELKTKFPMPNTLL